MKQENSKFLYELIDSEGRKITDVIKAQNLFEAFNIVDGEMGVEIFKDLHIKSI